MADWEEQSVRGSWTCTACGQAANWKKRDSCRACGAPQPNREGTGKSKGKGKGQAGTAELSKMMAQVLKRQQQLDAKMGQLSKGPAPSSPPDPKLLFEETSASLPSGNDEEGKVEGERIRGELTELRRILGNDHPEVSKRDERLMQLARQRGPGAERLRIHNRLAKLEKQAERIESDILQAEQQVKHWCDSRTKLDKEKAQVVVERKALKAQQNQQGGTVSQLAAFKEVLQMLARAAPSGPAQPWLEMAAMADHLLARPAAPAVTGQFADNGGGLAPYLEPVMRTPQRGRGRSPRRDEEPLGQDSQMRSRSHGASAIPPLP
eukprot:6454953-Amphidinium_carterae.3